MVGSLKAAAARSFMAAALSAPLFLTVSFDAAAHLPDEGPQHDMLAPYKGFIMKMRRADEGLCCNGDDAMGNMDEEISVGDDGATHYRVLMKMDLKGIAFPDGPRWVDIPDDKILTVEHAREFCRKLKEDEPDSEEAQSCNMPTFNMIWWRPKENSYVLPYTGQTYTQEDIIWCYFPKPDLR